MATMKGKRVLTSLYLDPEVAVELKELSKKTRVPQAVYLREAVVLMLAHYRSLSELTVGKKDAAAIPHPPVLDRFVRAATPAKSVRKSKKGKK